MKKGVKHTLCRFNRKRYDGIVESYLAAIDTPRSLAIWLMFKYKSHDELVSVKCDPRQYLCPLSFHKDYLATKFLSKFNGLETSFDKTATAIGAFHRSEVRCWETNERLVQPVPSGVSEVIKLARRKIRRVLGEMDSIALEKIFSASGPGPGVTTTLKGRWLSPYRKFGDDSPEVTTKLHDCLSSSLAADDYPSWHGIFGRRPVAGNSVITVPKNSKTDRTIAIEPFINSFFQKGVGKFIRNRLRRRMLIDLTDQTVNQEFARLGSLGWGFATLDLESASDTISLEAVRTLLPGSWVNLLECLRSPSYYLDGVWRTYEKHSSMGNGYTFELETLIFAAVSWAVAASKGRDWEGTCYGDDLIIPECDVVDVRYVLEYLGFSLNNEKSFWDSPFRESCGSDYWEGTKCTPFYLKKQRDNVQIQNFANWLRAEAPEWLDIRDTWAACVAYLPRPFTRPVPADAGLYGLWSNVWDWDPYSRRQLTYKSGLSGYKISGLRFRSSHKVPPDCYSAVASTLFRLEFLQLTPDSAYERREDAREQGQWYRASIVYDGGWPSVRRI